MRVSTAIQTLTTAALVLPGVLQAAEDDSLDFQYSHYQEGRRDGTFTDLTNANTGEPVRNIKVANLRNPIEVDSIHGSARVSLTDRIKFAFNYIEDTWSGATPFGSAPERSLAISYHNPRFADDGMPIITGASPYAAANVNYVDAKGNPFYRYINRETGEISFQKDRPVHVLSYASPETRKQGDFKLTYDWDEVALTVGGGISTERDYESRFFNLGGHMDFNQKRTTVNLGLSYTNSDINATLNHSAYKYIETDAYQNQIDDDAEAQQKTIHGTRQDWAAQLDLTQVLDKDSVVNIGMGYTRSTGFMENPYKLAWVFGILPDQPFGLPDGLLKTDGDAFLEQRPDERNLWNWTVSYSHFITPLDAALHFNYQLAHDDWGINAHTFAADWVQPLGGGWTIAPRVRYYSQEAADFYQPFFVTQFDKANGITPPANFSSDQRLSGYGALSGGLTVSQEFAKGIRLETGFEYYTHQGSLKLGGGGERAFADFDYWVANAALKVNLSSLGQAASDSGHSHHLNADHPAVPAGILFGHTLAKAGDMMAGYRYMHSQQTGNFLHGDHSVPENKILAKGCPGSFRADDDGISHFDGECSFLPQDMTMGMHMLELMYAPADWLTLMLMPQFADMQMKNAEPSSLTGTDHEHNAGHAFHNHETGGIGDTGMYGLVTLFDHSIHHIHAGFGFTAPTGDVGIKTRQNGTKDQDGAYIHYGMQLGSGTWDFKPSITYTGKTRDWNWGGQVAGTKRLETKNESGYALGDLFEASIWGGYDFTHWLTGTVRMAYTWQSRIKGRYPRSTRLDYTLSPCSKQDYITTDDPDGDGIFTEFFDQKGYNQCLADIETAKRQFDAQDRPSPMDFPRNYGGQYVDLGLGISATIPDGAFAGNRLAFEWLQPIYTNVNGYQLDRDGALSFTWSYGF